MGAALAAVPILIVVAIGSQILIPEEVKQGWRNTYEDAIDSILGEGVNQKINVATQQVIQDGIKNAVNLLRGGGAISTTPEVSVGELLAHGVVEGFKQGMDASTKEMIGYLNASLIPEDYGKKLKTGGIGLDGSMFAASIGEGVENYDYLPVQQAILTGIVPPVGAVTEATTAMKTEFDGAIVGLVTSTGTLDPNTINANYLIPLQTAFEATFGEASSTRLAYVTFFDTLVQKMQTTGTGMINVMLNAGILATGLIAAALLMAVTSVPLFEKINTALQKILDTYLALQLAAQKPIKMTIGATYTESGNAPPGGGIGGEGISVEGVHAGGLDYVPHDNYIGSLHKGEGVLTAAENKVWQNMKAKPDQPANTTNSETTYQNNKIYISGVQDVDGMLRELKRRGIKLG